MHLIFERGDHDLPVGHTLIYFRADTGAILATYLNIPPIEFDLNSYMPPIFAAAMQGMTEGIPLTPIPPIPEEVPGVEYLQALAVRRQDDLVYAGATMRADPGRMLADVQEAAAAYRELYDSSDLPEKARPGEVYERSDEDTARFSTMDEHERLNELTTLIGRLRDSLRGGGPDPEIERQIRRLADLLPAKYRGPDLVEAAFTPGDRGQKLAELYLERSYKLYREDYLDLERIDREIEAMRT